MYKTREEVAEAVAEKLLAQAPELARAFQSSGPVRHFVVDDLLDPDWVRWVAQGFPPHPAMLRRASIREQKRVSVAVDAYQPQVRAGMYAFQDPRVVRAVSQITGIEQTRADPTLYASGVSVMVKSDFLNPHIDNSHDGDGEAYRVLNLLYYVTPGWKREHGGNLELWDPRVRHALEVEARFNRLVVMETHQTSWHSVNKVRVDDARRCLSNYYFSPVPPGGRPYRNVTTFTGRPEEPLKRAVLGVVDGIVLNTIGRTFPSLLRRTRHRVKPAGQAPARGVKEPARSVDESAPRPPG